MVPDGKRPSKWMMNQLDLHFGGFERFQKLWIHHCTSIFGQGWVWLIDNDGHLEIATSFNAGNPVGTFLLFFSRHLHGFTVGRRGVSPLLLIDMWEHAYVMDYGNNVEVRDSLLYRIDSLLLAIC